MWIYETVVKKVTVQGRDEIKYRKIRVKVWETMDHIPTLPHAVGVDNVGM